MIARNVTKNTLLGDQIVLAHTRREINRGLLGREQLQTGEGMWLNPCGSVHTFWMKFAIDVVYLSRDMRALKIVHQMWPWNMSFAPWSSHSTLELPIGTCRQTGTEVGDRLAIE